MSEALLGTINRILDSLYNKFILRDVLSYFLPGAVIVLALISSVAPLYNIIYSPNNIPWLIYIILLGSMYFAGLFIQAIGTIIKLIGFYPGNTNFQSSTAQKEKDLYERILTAVSSNEERANIYKNNHERYVILKQLHGNSGMAILLSSIIIILARIFNCGYWIRYEYWKILILIGACIIFLVFMIKEHWNLVRRQYLWETTYISMIKKEKQ